MSQQTAVSRRKIAGERLRRTPIAAPAVGPLGADVDAVSAARPRQGTRLPLGRAVPGWLLIGLAAPAVAVLVLDVVIWARSGAASGDGTAIGPAALNAAPAQAEKAAEQILSYDYASLRDDTAAAAAAMTPAYAQTFQRTVDDLLADSATASRGVVSAKVKASGVISAADGKVDVLLFVDQTSQTAADESTQIALNRVVLTMVYQDGRWLVDDVTAL